MKGKRRIGLAVPLVSLLIAPLSNCLAGDHDVYWHIDPSVESCSMVIDPSLTQAQWKKFARESGAMLTFKSLAPVEPLGRLNFTLGVDYSITPIDQRDPAWINTFTHPDADCPLGDRIELPTIRARVGVSSTVDLGGIWTTAPDANYGLVGGDLRYALLKESERAPAVAVSASAVWLTGVADFDYSIYSLGFVASKRISVVTPYVGLRESVTAAKETTSKVDLDTENLALTQGFIGIAYSIWRVRLAAEYDVAAVNTLAFVIGIQPRAQLP